LQGLLTGWAAARPRRCRLRLVRGRGEHGSAAPSNVALLAFGIVLLRLVLPWTVSDFRAEPHTTVPLPGLTPPRLAEKVQLDQVDEDEQSVVEDLPCSGGSSWYQMQSRRSE
jgi:hypothetical protein